MVASNQYKEKKDIRAVTSVAASLPWAVRFPGHPLQKQKAGQDDSLCTVRQNAEI
jgi:hypothetical protein